jgi:transposase
MGRHLELAAHLSADDVERRYRTAKQAVERTWWQIVWLVSRGQTATAIARSTGFSRGWIGQVIKRYNALGPEGLHDRRQTHSRRQAPALSAEQQAELLAMVEGPPPRGELWTGRLVAEWMSERLGRPIPRQLGWVYLVRLKGKRRTPRPRHVQADAEQQAEFKKRSARSSRPSPPPSPARRSSSGRSTNTASA